MRARAAFPVALCVLGGVLLAAALLRPRLVTNDSYGYVDVARNVARGAGLTQNAIGFNAAAFPRAAEAGEPVTVQPPGFALLVAVPVRLGVEPMRAALLVSLLGFLATVGLGGALAGRTWGAAAGPLAAGLLALPAAAPAIGDRAWSEWPALAFALLSLVLDAGPRRGDGRRGAGASLASGLAAGAAFAVRYALVVGLAAGLLRRSSGRDRDARAAAAFGLGWALAAAPVLARNLALTGSPTGAAHAGFAMPLGAVLGESVRTLAAHRGLVAAAALAALASAGLLLAHARRRGAAAAWAEWPGREGAWLLAWALAYAALVLGLRTRFGFDAAGLRLLLPALVTAGIVGVGLPARALALRSGVVATGAALLLLALAAARGAALARTPAESKAAFVARHGRLEWVRDHVGPGDLVIAEAGADLPYFFSDSSGAPLRVVSFAPAPYMEPVRFDDVRALVGHHRTAHPECRRAWILAYRRDREGDAWPESGPFYAALVRGAGLPEDLERVAVLPEAFAYRVRDAAGALPGGPGAVGEPPRP